MLIGEVARSTGLSASAIRFYEKQGIVPPPERSAGGFRHYREEDSETLLFVRRLRSLNLPLEDVREVIALRAGGAAPCGSVRDALAREAARLDREIRSLIRIRGRLSSLRAAADGVEDDWPGNCVCTLVDSGGADPSFGLAVGVTLQYFDGCPNWEETERRLARLGVPVTLQRIETVEDSLRHEFRGSPTVLVNGADPFHDPDAPIGLSCRVYRAPTGPTGVPSVDDLKKAIDAARKEASTGPTASSFR